METALARDKWDTYALPIKAGAVFEMVTPPPPITAQLDGGVPPPPWHLYEGDPGWVP